MGGSELSSVSKWIHCFSIYKIMAKLHLFLMHLMLFFFFFCISSEWKKSNRNIVRDLSLAHVLSCWQYLLYIIPAPVVLLASQVQFLLKITQNMFLNGLTERSLKRHPMPMQCGIGSQPTALNLKGIIL